jgi:hypothetical protein
MSPFELPKSGTLVLFSDIHTGAEAHDAELFDESLRWCKDNDAAIYLNGDLLENSIASGKSPGEKLLEQATNPNEQVKEFVAKLKPFAKRGRIVGITRGNHEARSRREAMIDLCEIIADLLSIPYHRIGGYVRFAYGGHIYVGGIHHGRSAAKNIWLELDRMLSLYPSSDFVACGHNHALDARTVHFVGVGKDGAERADQRWQIRTGTYLRWAEYARELALPPSPIGSPIVRFGAKTRSVEVDVRTLRWLR